MTDVIDGQNHYLRAFVEDHYLRAFVIGSSFFVFLPYFYSVLQIPLKKRNYNYSQYTFIAPLFLGLVNMLSLYISNKFYISRQISLFVISLFIPFTVILFAIIFKFYNYTTSEWIYYIGYIYLLYIFVWNVVVYYLDKYV